MCRMRILCSCDVCVVLLLLRQRERSVSSQCVVPFDSNVLDEFTMETLYFAVMTNRQRGLSVSYQHSFRFDRNVPNGPST